MVRYVRAILRDRRRLERSGERLVACDQCGYWHSELEEGRCPLDGDGDC